LQKVLWQKYIWHRQTVKQLAKSYSKSERWIRQQLETVPMCQAIIKPQPVVVVADTTFFKKKGQGFGVCVFRSPQLKKNLIWRPVLTENADIYFQLRYQLEKRGFKLKAAIIDGKPGVYEIFSDLPVQMCHFHQSAIMTRYLTARPKLPAGQILRQIALTITRSNEDRLRKQLSGWHQQWESFLNEKTFNPETNRKFYTHRRLRSAHRSITKNLPLLYTYQKYPELNIPNTTNSLDGSFSHLKDMLRIHRGLNRTKKLKMVDEILSK